MRTRPQSVVVIGAGVTGLSTAFHLVEKGVERVVVVDKGSVGGGSSLQAGGIITMLMATETEVRARSISLDLFERFSRILDGYHFHQVGCLNLSTENASATSAQSREMWRQLGGQFEVLSGGEISERFPDLVAQETDIGILDLRSGYSEPHRYIPALRAKIEDMGVEIRENEAVVGFDLRGGRVRGVEMDEGTIEADAAVCAVNAWTKPHTVARGVSHPLQELRAREIRNQAVPGVAKAARSQRSHPQRLRAAHGRRPAARGHIGGQPSGHTKCAGRTSVCRNWSLTRTLSSVSQGALSGAGCR